MERNCRTWQGRLPQELRLAGATTLEQADRFLREHYIPEFNRKCDCPRSHFTGLPSVLETQSSVSGIQGEAPPALLIMHGCKPGELGRR